MPLGPPIRLKAFELSLSNQIDSSPDSLQRRSLRSKKKCRLSLSPASRVAKRSYLTAEARWISPISYWHSLLEHSITSCYRNSQLTHDLRYANDCAKSIAFRKIQRNDHRVAGIDM